MHQNAPFLIQKVKNFSEDGYSPSPDPFPLKRGNLCTDANPLDPHSKTPGFATENNSNSITIVPLLNDMKLVQ